MYILFTPLAKSDDFARHMKIFEALRYSGHAVRDLLVKDKGSYQRAILVAGASEELISKLASKLGTAYVSMHRTGATIHDGESVAKVRLRKLDRELAQIEPSFIHDVTERTYFKLEAAQ